MIKQRRIDPASRLERLITTAEPRIRSVFLRAVRAARSEVKLNQLIALLEQGMFDEALELARSIPVAIATQVSATFVITGASTAEIISTILQQPVHFDQTNIRAVSVMQRNRLDLIAEFTNEQRLATSTALLDGIQRGVNPREQARLFRDSIGLTQRQVHAVNNYRRLLQEGSREALSRQLRDRRFDSTVSRAVRDGEALTSQQVDKMVSRYQERYLKYRSEVIARTEALRSVHQANDEMYQQAFDDGVLDPSELQRKWNNAGDSRVRESHNGMGGQTRAIHEPFLSDQGNLLRFPGDPDAPAEEVIQCRCRISTRFL